MTRIRSRIWLASIVLCAFAAAACAADSEGGPELNPQPLPPTAPTPEPPSDPSRSAEESPAAGSYDSNGGKGGTSSGGGGSSSGSSGASGAPPPAPHKDGGANPTSWQLYQLIPQK